MNINDLLPELRSYCIYIIVGLLGVGILLSLLRRQHYKRMTGRNLGRDQRENGPFYYDLLRRYKKENLMVNPRVPKKLLHTTPEGIFFGKVGNRFVCLPKEMEGACLLIGGAGSGKTSCCVIPTIQSWGTRILAVDVKGELVKKALSREQLQHTRIFAPSDPTSDVGYDPFYLARTSMDPAQAIREIAFALIEAPPGLKDPFWVTSAQNVLTGTLLYGYARGMSFVEIMKWLLRSDPKEILDTIRYSGNEAAQTFVTQYFRLKDETLSGIWAEMLSHVTLFGTDPEVYAALQRENIFTPEDLEEGKSVFLVIPEEKIEQWKGLLTLIVNQFLKAFERRPEGKDPILMILDETPRLGKLRLVEGLSTLRSRQIHIVPVIQSISQLDMIYGIEARKVITDNCPYKILLGAGDSGTCEWLSQLCGTYQKTAISYSHSQQDLDYKNGKSVTISEQERRVIRPEEFGHMTDIILINPINGFCRISKAPYYEQRKKKKRRAK